MAENFSKITFDQLSDFTPYEGFGRADILPKDGLYEGKIEKVEPMKTKTNNERLVVGVTVTDTDAEGAHLVGAALYTGTDKNGRPNIRQLGELLLASGTTLEKIRKLKGEVDPVEVGKSLVGKIVYMDVSATTDDKGELSSNVNWSTRERYAAAKAAGTHRRTRREVSRAGSYAPAAGADPFKEISGANGATPTTSDPLEALRRQGART